MRRLKMDAWCLPPVARKNYVLSLRWSLLKENRLLSFAERVPSLCMRRPFSWQGLMGVSAFFVFIFNSILFYFRLTYLYLFSHL